MVLVGLNGLYLFHLWLHLTIFYIMILVDISQRRSPIQGANYLPHFQEDKPNYSDPATYATGSQNTLGLGSWEEILEQCTTGFGTVPSRVSVSSGQPASTGVTHEQQNMVSGNLLAGQNITREELRNSPVNYSTWQVLNVSNILDILITPYVYIYKHTCMHRISNCLHRSSLSRPKLNDKEQALNLDN